MPFGKAGLNMSWVDVALQWPSVSLQRMAGGEQQGGKPKRSRGHPLLLPLAQLPTTGLDWVISGMGRALDLCHRRMAEATVHT